MTAATTLQGSLFARVLDPANRPDPYPLYARLRESPVSRQDDDTHVVSTYAEIAALLHDPRISSDERKSARGAGALVASGRLSPEGQAGNPPFIFRDPPDHDRLRRIVMRQFTPQRIAALHDRVARLVAGLLDAKRGGDRLDVVADLAYPLPVTVICELLGVPREDEPRFHVWASALARSLDPAQGMSEDEIREAIEAAMQMLGYLGGLIAARRAEPGDDLLSGLVAGGDPAERMDEQDLLRTTALLLIAGHETTVNLIANGILTLLRHPDALDRLRHEPDFVIPLTEELLRYEPPVQFRTRTTLAEIGVAGATIPRGATVVLLLASGSRDPARFPDADRFVPDRSDNAHLGFGGGIHYCVGAPLARMEAHIALSALARRLVAPRLLADPPPYRENASLRGPARLPVGFERLAD
ncbi:MAG TPA: cytochrome P450 [Stellaceae bacterium]|nr:cytochrome P450 [Stellaceae bacterium]